MYELHSINKRFGISLSSSHLDTMLGYCQHQPGVETGGVLVGQYNLTLDMAHVTEVQGPPSDSRHGRTWFYRGTKGLQTWLNHMWQVHQAYYLGEWHYHPNAAPVPSSEDIKQMSAIAWSTAYHCPEPVLLIVGGSPDADWSAGGYVMPRGKTPVNLYPMIKSSPKS
jgi:integrative and conjugative element protein (TIGR02256 family)